MFEYTLTEEDGLRCFAPKGRIDALSSSEIQKVFDDLIVAGERILIADMTAVHYVSSAGLRTFIATQKALKKAGGEIILLGMTDPVFDIFRMSGLVPLFRLVRSKGDIAGLLMKDAAGGETSTRKIDGITFEYTETGAGKGNLFPIGSQDKSAGSSYREEDVAIVTPAKMPFGCGLATLGDTYEEYRYLFGESLVMNNSFFFYPAVKHPSVDFLISANQNPGTTYKFLHGFGFTGSYRYTLAFRGDSGSVELAGLVKALFAVSRADLLGICILAESKGFWGMHIKQVPIAENKPAEGRSIFDRELFPQWIDFPVEPSYVNNTIAATGIAVRDRTFLNNDKSSLISEGSFFHIHGAVFDKAPLGSDADNFDKELLRVFNEREVYKIQHMLGQSRFSGGMAAIIELET